MRSVLLGLMWDVNDAEGNRQEGIQSQGYIGRRAEVDHFDMSSKVEVQESRVLHAVDEEAAVGSHESGAACCDRCRDRVGEERTVRVRRPRRAHVGGRWRWGPALNSPPDPVS